MIFVVGDGMTRSKSLLILQVLLGSCIAFAGDRTTSCTLLGPEGFLARTASGLAQVSNLGIIYIACTVPQRPLPSTPGSKRLGLLQVRTTAYEVSRDGREKLVGSEVNVTSGMRGVGVAADQEVVWFFLDLPLDPAEQQAEAERYWAKIQDRMPPEAHSQEGREEALKRLRQCISQYRVGQFRVECRVMDGKRVLGIGTVHFEVLFEGHFVDWQTEFKPLFNVPTEPVDATDFLVPEKPILAPAGLDERPPDHK